LSLAGEEFLPQSVDTISKTEYLHTEQPMGRGVFWARFD